MQDDITDLRELRDQIAGTYWLDPYLPAIIYREDFIAICNVVIRHAEAGNRPSWWRRTWNRWMVNNDC